MPILKYLYLSLLICCVSVPLAAQGDGLHSCRTLSGILWANSQEQKVFLPLKKTNVRLEVTAGIVYANVTQSFTNDTSHPLEAIYIFPLPSRATIVDMTLRIGDRIIKSVVKEREQAKKIYTEAKRAGKKAALLEQERPNIFTTSVANFQPGETVAINFGYLEPAAYQRNLYTINFPMVVGQRYIPFGIEIKDPKRLNPPLLHPNIAPQHRLSLEAYINGIEVQKIISNTHAIKVEPLLADFPRYKVTLGNDQTIPDSDFNLQVHLKKQDTPQVSLLHSQMQNATYALLTIFPPTKKASSSQMATMPRDVIFLIDTSGSMSGNSIGQAKSGLKQCLKMLKNDDMFTIVRFANDYSSFSPQLRPATAAKIEAAGGYIDNLTADGGTEMQKALQYVLGLKTRADSMCLIIFLTDGDVGNEDSLMRLLHQKLQKTRLFTFGIGSAPNEFLMRKMAEIGRGQSRFIRSHEDIGSVMADFFNTLASPVFTDITVAWQDAVTVRPDIVSYPSPCPDVFYERPLQIYAKFSSIFRGKLLIAGKINGQTAQFAYDLDSQQQQHFPAIDKMFARMQINDLMFQILRTQNAQQQEQIAAQVVRVSLAHQIVSKYTSRVAVEERVEKQADGKLVTVKIPVQLPKGWDRSQFTPTATTIWFRLLIGLAMCSGCLAIMYLRKHFLSL